MKTTNPTHTSVPLRLVLPTQNGEDPEMRPLAMTRRLADEHRCSVIVASGGNRMVAAGRGGGRWYLPAEPSAIRDVRGTGATVLASVGVAIAAGNALRGVSQRPSGFGCGQLSRESMGDHNRAFAYSRDHHRFGCCPIWTPRRWAVDRSRLTWLIVNWCFRNQKCFTCQFCCKDGHPPRGVSGPQPRPEYWM